MKEEPEAYSRMIAACVIGYSVTDVYLAENPYLRFAAGGDDARVIIAYNTEAPDVKGNNPVLLHGANVINPITWTREATLATAERSLGSFMPNAEGQFVLVENYADARVDKTKGVLVCSTVNPDKLPAGSHAFGRGIYHSLDYPFYCFNIRENATNRAKSFDLASPTEW